MSKFNPLDIMKTARGGAGKWSLLLRNFLLLIQFVISAGLLISVLVINRQMSFIKDKDWVLKRQYPRFYNS